MYFMEGSMIDSKKRNIMIIEDDVTLKTFLTSLLYFLDPTVNISWCPSADEAISELKRMGSPSECNYDLIVADIYTPGKTNGFDLFKLCNRFLPQVPFIVTSGISTYEFLKGIDLKCVAPLFLAKPLAVGQCKQVFQSIFGTLDRNSSTHKNPENTLKNKETQPPKFNPTRMVKVGHVDVD
jgi:YesN/AraC family two-component response regulator